MKAAIILDFDGTFAASYDALAAQLGYATNKESLGQLGDDTPVVGDNPASPAPSAGEPRPVPLDEDYAGKVYSVVRELYDRGVKLVVTSDYPVKVSEALMKQLAIDLYFAGYYGPESGGEKKPHPSMVHRALADLAIRPDDALFIGDLLVDVEMGHAAGLQVAVVVGAAGRTQCVAEAPDHVIYDWMHVLELVGT